MADYSEERSERITQLSRLSTNYLLAAIYIMLEESALMHKDELGVLRRQLQEIQDKLNHVGVQNAKNLYKPSEPLEVRIEK